MSTSTTGPIPRPVLRLVRTEPRASKADAMLARASFRIARRRRLMLLTPMIVACASSLYGLMTTHAPRGAGPTALTLIPPLAWLIALVLLPFAAAVKPNPVRVGAVAAIVLGPLLMPLLFGAGGWRLPEALIALAAAAGTLIPQRSLLPKR